MFVCVKSLLVLILLHDGIKAKPVDDAIFFPDDVPETFVGLNDENQILRSKDESRLIADDIEVKKGLENGRLYQGDIVLQPAQKEELNAIKNGDLLPTRTGVLDEEYRWPKDDRGNVILTYNIDANAKFCKNKNKFAFVSN